MATPLPRAKTTNPADRRWLAADERGSVVAVSDVAGAVLAINRYDVYGIPAAGNLGRFQYTGQTWLPEVELYNYKARVYSPSLGRFMQTDPIGYGDGMNMYAYVGNDPVNGVDPTGLSRNQLIWDKYDRQTVDIECPGPFCPTTRRDQPFKLFQPRLASGTNTGIEGMSFGILGAPQNLQRNGQKPPSHDEGDPDYNRDLKKCRALSDAGNRAAARRCYSSAETRKGLRDGGTPEGALPPLITWRTPAVPVPGPSAPNPWVTGGVIVGGAAVVCAIVEPCGAAALGVLGLGSLGLLGAQ